MFTLVINFSTSTVDSVGVEILDAEGFPIQGFTLVDCKDIYGDHTKHVVTWEGGSDVSSLAG